MEKVAIDKMVDLIQNYWTPLDIFRVNETAVKVVKIVGKYHWHKHTTQDELFIVHKGQLKINFQDRQVLLEEGEGLVVKKGVLHQTEADEEAVILLVEPIDIITQGD